MIRQLITALLLLVFAVQTFSRVVIVLDFYANQAYIAKNLCENRNKPKMNCCGKCQLHKQLKQADNNDKQDPERKLEPVAQVLSSKSFFATVQVCILHAGRTYLVPGNIGHPVDLPSPFFHPPCRLVA